MNDPYEKDDVVSVTWPGAHGERWADATIKRITTPKHSRISPRKGQIVQRLHFGSGDAVDVAVRAA